MAWETERRRLDAANEDSADARIHYSAAAQPARLNGAQTHPPDQCDPDRQPSRWAHVPLGELFTQAGNTVVERRNGTAECGHEPMHGSKSGRCLVIFPGGRWYCRSCVQSGDAPALIMQLHDWSYAEAADWLVRRYGPPPGWRRAGPVRRRVPLLRHNPSTHGALRPLLSTTQPEVGRGG